MRRKEGTQEKLKKPIHPAASPSFSIRPDLSFPWSAQIQSMRKYAENINHVAAEISARQECYNNVATHLARSSDDDSSDALRATYARTLQQVEEKAQQAAVAQPLGELAKIDRLISVLSSSARGGGDGDSDVDIDIEENLAGNLPQQPRRCPVTNGALVNPVKNRTCEHVYSLQGAIQILFQANGATAAELPTSLDDVPPHFWARCPSVGCSERISAASLRRDFQTEITQRQILSSSRKMSVDVDDLN